MTALQEGHALRAGGAMLRSCRRAAPGEHTGAGLVLGERIAVGRARSGAQPIQYSYDAPAILVYSIV